MLHWETVSFTILLVNSAKITSVIVHGWRSLPWQGKNSLYTREKKYSQVGLREWCPKNERYREQWNWEWRWHKTKLHIHVKQNKTKVHIPVKTVTWWGFRKTKKRWPGLLGSARLAWVSYILQETVITRVIWKEERQLRIIYLAFCISTLGLAYLKTFFFPSEAVNKLRFQNFKIRKTWDGFSTREKEIHS